MQSHLTPITSYLLSITLQLVLGSSAWADSNSVTWAMHSIDASGDGADGVHIGDFDKNGTPDVVTGWTQSREMKLYLNPGASQARQGSNWGQVDISGGLNVEGIEDAAFADMDGDGEIDSILSSIEEGERYVGIHRPTGPNLLDPKQWTATRLGPVGDVPFIRARAAQLDGLNGPDIVAGSKCIKYPKFLRPFLGKCNQQGKEVGLFWFRAPTDPMSGSEWERFKLGQVNKKVTTIELFDFDQDGDTDVLYSASPGLGWFENPGPDKLALDPAHHWPHHVIDPDTSEFTLCDLDGDGEKEIVTTLASSGTKNPIIAKWYKRIDLDHFELHTISTDFGDPDGKNPKMKFSYKGIGCGEVVSQGKNDLVFTVVGVGHGSFMLHYDKDPTEPKWNFTTISGFSGPTKYDNLVLVDIDGDSDLDVVSAEENQGKKSRGLGVFWFENPSH